MNPLVVRQTCASFTSTLAYVDVEAAKVFASSMDIAELTSFCLSADGLSTNRFDTEVAFESVQDEAGFIFFAHGLDFGSGFRYVLHNSRNGQGAWLTIRAGLVEMGKVDPKLTCSWLKSITVDEVIRYFDLSGDSDGLRPLAAQLHTSIVEIGTNLLSMGFACPGDILAAKLNISRTSSTESSIASTTACDLVQVLVESFPLTFKDEYLVNGHRVCFYKKAQLVVSELFMRFYESCPSSFNFSDIDLLTAFVDNVVVAMMRMNRIVVCSPALAEKIENGVYLEKGSEEEVAIRASALHGVELLASFCKDRAAADGYHINSQRICNWLWGCLGKKPAFRQFPRHLCPSTSFY